MIWRILDNGEEINRIVGGEAFVTDYCAMMGYTYEAIPEPEPPEPEPTEIEVLQQENKQLKDQVSALSTQAEFHEECLVELAQVVYA